ncbi:MAG: bifunctional riboflavin kinase/FAD synthetase [Cyclobacteriaceae bacterium]|nr:bifunctional riboflavin kinase/FAD synthetase [Cyclobacteriaceae bacterium]
MKIYNGISEFKRLDKAIVTSGTFDGVHLGHQKILQRIVQTALKEKGETVLITFWPHPRLVLQPDIELFLINTFEEKAILLEKFGIDHLIKLPFTREFSNLTSEDFIKDILIKGIGTKKLVIGYNHRFGKNREGSFDHLMAHQHHYGFEVEEIPRQEIDDMGVSSTRIRKAILEGHIDLANRFLGYKYTLTGQVVNGDKIGRQIGFPTANIVVSSANKIIPGDGVYPVFVRLGKDTLKGMLYIGNRPTLNGLKRSIEVNIFDFNEDIYDKSITIEFIKQTRGDLVFKNLEELRQQLIRDKEESLKIFTSHDT